MKKLAMMALLFGVNAVALAAENGTVSFSGEVTGSTCNVNVAAQGPDATIVLAAVSADDLNTQKTMGYTPFSIVMSNCIGTYDTARVFFEEGPNVSSQGYLINNGGTASGVVLVLTDSDKNVITPGSDTQKYSDITSGTATTNYYVAYGTNSTVGTAMGGTVSSSVTYHLDYK
ncbi:fimbrial protein [Scandinavium sp. NPDC088450]|uniref:fimbrial protein n=1 Tax=Scandinavium sp. NPDC088450 TaxID=3364514 RepID=UPI00384E959B